MQNYSSKFKINQVDIKVRAYKYSLEIVKLCKDISRLKVNLIIVDQLMRSATSIGANIIEAQAASSKKDFRRFLSYSLKSANETKYWLGILRDSDIVNRLKINPLLQRNLQHPSQNNHKL